MDVALLVNPVLLVINALAVGRLTRLVVLDAFPFGMLRGRIIDWAQERWGPYRRTYAPRPADREPAAGDARALLTFGEVAPLAYLITCPWCASVYLGAAVTVLAATGTWWLWISIPLALSAVAGILASLTD